MPSVHAGGESTVGRRRRVAGSLSEINVVPLVDVMLVLLIIFMVTAPLIQRGIDVNVPSARRSTQITNEQVFVSVPLAYKQNRLVYLGEEAVRIDVLQERIRQQMRGRSDKGVYLRSDGGLTVQDMMEVMDRLKDGGVEKVSIVTKLPNER